jgi:S-adenosyl-L-methionine hydrolase (adenosine-forming)
MPKREKKGVSGIVTLTTDFGLQGGYIGAVKGSILKVNPLCQIVDITHLVSPQNIIEASFIIKTTYPFFPAGTIHLVIVDPGVGTGRKPIVLKEGKHIFVGPDNGVFSLILAGSTKIQSYQITCKEFFLKPLSHTFHGRDLFAPVAGHLSLGLDPKSLGPRLENLFEVEWPEPKVQAKRIVGRIIFADSFGNLITNISREQYGGILEGRGILIQGKGWKIGRLCRTYGQGQIGQPMALFGSSGFLEVAVHEGNAMKKLNLHPGDPIPILFFGGR